MGPGNAHMGSGIAHMGPGTGCDNKAKSRYGLQNVDLTSALCRLGR